MPNEHLDIFSLRKSREQKIHNRLITFKEILRKCHIKIQNSSEALESKCLFVIPEYVLGMPLYNSEMCKVYLVNALKEEKFDVKFFFPNILFISWEKIVKKSDPNKLANYNSNNFKNYPKLLTNNEEINDIKLSKPSNSLLLKNEPELSSIIPDKTFYIKHNDDENKSNLKYIKTGKLFS